MEEQKKQIALCNLSPYFPEYNPDEYLKHFIDHREMVKDKRNLLVRADELLDGFLRF